MKILVIGGFNDDNPESKEKTLKFVEKLSKQIVNNGHTLLNACRTEFDAVLAEINLQPAEPCKLPGLVEQALKGNG